MAEYKLALKKREFVGKKAKLLRKDGLVPSVVYGGKEPVLASSEYVPTEKVLEKAGYHSPIDLDIDGKKQLAIVKDIHVNPISREIINIEFQAISAKEVVEATTPIIITNYEESEASKIYHFAMTQSIEELDIKAKPSDLPSELTINASNLKEVTDKITIADLELPKGVTLADQELSKEQVIASLYDPAAEAEKREAEDEAEPVDAADVPADHGRKPEETATE